MKMIQGHILQSSDAIHALAKEEMTSISKLGYKSRVFFASSGIGPSSFKYLPDRSKFLAVAWSRRVSA